MRAGTGVGVDSGVESPGPVQAVNMAAHSTAGPVRHQRRTS
jgi:hypothetical protein